MISYTRVANRHALILSEVSVFHNVNENCDAKLVQFDQRKFGLNVLTPYRIHILLYKLLSKIYEREVDDVRYCCCVAFRVGPWSYKSASLITIILLISPLTGWMEGANLKLKTCNKPKQPLFLCPFSPSARHIFQWFI